MFESGRGLQDSRYGQDLSAVLAQARVMRSQAAADVWRRAFALCGRPLRPLGRAMAQGRRNRQLRRELAGLDVRTLRDLGLSPQLAAEATWEALADHPMAVGRSRGIANENAGARRARSAA